MNHENCVDKSEYGRVLKQLESSKAWYLRCMHAESALRACRDSIQGYKDTNPLNEESVLNKALKSKSITNRIAEPAIS